jgi:hypothetical protein
MRGDARCCVSTGRNGLQCHDEGKESGLGVQDDPFLGVGLASRKISEIDPLLVLAGQGVMWKENALALLFLTQCYSDMVQ